MGTIRQLAGSDDGVGMTDQTGWLCGGEKQQNQQKDGDEGRGLTNGGPPTARTRGHVSIWRKSGRFEHRFARLGHGTKSQCEI